MADGRLFVSSDAELSDVEENTTKNVESKRANNINVVKYLNITEKGKLRLTGSFENLEILMNELLETQTKWSSPGGHCKLLEMDNFEMRWYSNNYSLIIKGEQDEVEEINSRLRIMANLADKETAFVSEGNGDREGDGVNTASTENSHIEINSHETSNYNKVLDSIRDLELCFVNKFDELLQEIRQSKTTEETISEDRNSLIKKNGKLKQEIDILSDQVNNYKCIVSDLHTKVKQLEDEQKSLITAIKI
ncbi:Hypothetical predicted protein, partial [Paramuricea clavata]